MSSSDAPTDLPPQPQMNLLQKTAALAAAIDDDNDPQASEALVNDIVALVKEHYLARYVDHILAEHHPAIAKRVGAHLPAHFQAACQTELTKQLAAAEAQLADAKENLGEQEVRDALMLIANVHSQFLTTDVHTKLDEAVDGAALGLQIDLYLQHARVALLQLEAVDEVAKYVASARKQLDQGGDWERRNSTTVYEGVVAMLSDDLNTASRKLLGVVPTFSRSEKLMPFSDFVRHTVFATLVAGDRATLREKIVSDPEILTGVDRQTLAFVENFLHCRYNEMFAGFVREAGVLRRDAYWARRASTTARSICENAYRQYLQPYKAVSVATMGKAFGLSPQFVEREIAAMVAKDRLACRISQAEGLIYREQRGARTAGYQEVIEKGDDLLNRMQRLQGSLDA